MRFLNSILCCLFISATTIDADKRATTEPFISEDRSITSAGQCGATFGAPNANTFRNLPKYRKRRSDDFSELHTEKTKKNKNGNKTKPGISAKANPFFQQRIVGGAPSAPNAWPWQVFLNFDRYSCGGTLMSNLWVITAVHCTFRHPPNSFIRLGLTNIADPTAGIRRNILRVVQHPEFYKPIDWNNDISLVQMDRPVEFTEYIKPICLPPPSLVIPDGTPCIVSGWGRSRKGGKISDSLQEVAVKLMSEERCKSYEGYANQLTDSMLCAGYEKGGRDACSGDSGGPMACKLMTPDISFSRGKRRKKGKKNKKQMSTASPVDEVKEAWVLYGITSWGAGCARERSPGVYVKVTKMIDWITEVTGIEFNGMARMEPETWHQKVGDDQDLPDPVSRDRTTVQLSESEKEMVCGRVLFGTTGEFSSPGYPKSYPADTKCEWVILPTKDMPYIRLNVTDMKFDARSGGCFINDHIRVYDGSDHQIGTALCKTGHDGWIVTSKGGMKIQLQTDGKIQKKGFSANYKLLKAEPSGCSNSDKVLDAANGGTFMSSGFPNQYPDNTECSWYIYSSQSNAILLQFSKFELEGPSWDGTCKFDYVSVYEGTDETGNLIESICGEVKKTKGDRIPKTHSFISATGEMFIKFRSDNSGVGTGFYASFREIADETVPSGHSLTGLGEKIV